MGLLSDAYLGIPASGADATWLYKSLYAVVPNFQFFWAGDVLTQERTIVFGHVGQVLAYAGLYSLGVLGLGVRHVRDPRGWLGGGPSGYRLSAHRPRRTDEIGAVERVWPA